MRVQADWVRSLAEVVIIYELRTSDGSSQPVWGSNGSKGGRTVTAGLQNASRSMAQKFLAVFCGAYSAHPAKHPCKVLLRFEAAGHRNVQDTRLGGGQHFLRTLYSMTQDKVMRALAG
jgi:hypothetical protein